MEAIAEVVGVSRATLYRHLTEPVPSPKSKKATKATK
jgi:predicted DNA-binding transcriptional regulator AlpA